MATIESLAKRTADTRRGLMSMYRSELGVRVVYDLMDIAPEDLTDANREIAASIVQTSMEGLSVAELYLADAGMVALLDASAPGMPDQELHLTDIPGPHGLILFSEPLPDRSGQPPELPIHALSWDFLDSENAIVQARDVTTASVLLTSYVRVVEQVEAMGFDPKDLAAGTPRLLPNATVVWTVGTLIGEVYGSVPEEARHTPGFYQRVMAAFWTFLNQPRMVAQETVPGGRPTDHRRYRRAGVKDPDAAVHVVRLHSPTSSSEGGGSESSDRHLSVRFPVRGHWRRQWMPKTETHRHIWIDPHWKGPEDAPVVGGERVFLAHKSQQQGS